MTHSVEPASDDRAIFEVGNLGVLLDGIKDAILITTVELQAPGPVITFVNRAFEHMTGYSRREVVGQTPRMLQGPETDRGELDRLRRVLEAGGTFEGQAINYRKDGASFMLGWAVVPILDGSGRKTGWLSVQSATRSARTVSLEERAVALEANLHTAHGA